MKLNLLIFGGIFRTCCCVLNIRTRTNRAHLFTVMVGWAIFMIGAALGLAFALVVIYFEMIVRSFK